MFIGMKKTDFFSKLFQSNIEAVELEKAKLEGQLGANAQKVSELNGKLEVASSQLLASRSELSKKEEELIEGMAKQRYF